MTVWASSAHGMGTKKMLSQWIRIPRDDPHIRHATNCWLSPDKVKVALGPDCDLSPHPVREVPLDISTPYIDMLLGPQKPARGQANQTVKQEESNTLEESQTQTIALPAPEEVLVTLRLQVDSCRPSDVSALIQILLGGTPTRCRNHHLWIQAVQDFFDDVPLCVPCCQLLRFVCETAPQQRCDLLAKKVLGRAPYSQRIIIRNWTKLNWSKTEQRCHSGQKLQTYKLTN